MQAEYPLSAAGRGKQIRRVLSSHTEPVHSFRNRNCVHLSTADWPDPGHAGERGIPLMLFPPPA